MTAVFVVAGVGPVLTCFLVVWFGRMIPDEIANPLDAIQDDGAEKRISSDA